MHGPYYRISQAQTTNECVRAIYKYGNVINTANKGCCHNWYFAFCSTRPTSNLPDFSHCVEIHNNNNNNSGIVPRMLIE